MSDSVFLQPENREAWNRMAEDLAARFQPADNIELAIVHDLAATQWRKERSWSLEAAILEAECDSLPEIENEPEIRRIARPWSADSGRQKALEDLGKQSILHSKLKELQKDRKAAELAEQEPPPPASADEIRETNPADAPAGSPDRLSVMTETALRVIAQYPGLVDKVASAIAVLPEKHESIPWPRAHPRPLGRSRVMLNLFSGTSNPDAPARRIHHLEPSMKHLLRVFALCAAPALAHDMWIEPVAFQVQPGRPVSLRLRVGQDLLGDPLPRDPSLIRQFIVEDSAGRRPVAGRIGGDPAGMVLAAQPGIMVAGYRSNHSTVEQDAAKFNEYLKEEGLETLPALRAWKATNRKVSEVFSRCAKSLIAAGGPAADAPADRTLGFTLELVAGKNPYTMLPGAEMPVRLTYESKPLAGALVVAINRLNPAAKVSARTDRDGRVRLKLDAGGMWLVKSVHLVPAPAGVKAEWESLWASLTFVIPTNAAISVNR